MPGVGPPQGTAAGPALLDSEASLAIVQWIERSPPKGQM